ncbi:MAG: FAD:protein transferase [Solirubrobacteraceae bacterium]|jgi:thiamine biosynthesis lipoprotein|nr:FAD:protein transferase [Solirubrobacteraceae bacterium]
MGMPIAIDIRDAHAGAAMLDRAFAFLRTVDATFSTFRADSEISRLNRGELRLRDARPVVREVLARCEHLRRVTGGYFDAGAPAPGALDPTGLVKGWAVDGVAALLEREGARRYCIDAGGDVRVRGGGAAPDTRWRVGIRHPHRHDRVAAVLEADDLAVATSGAYERGEHIVDPHTGRPPVGVLSVTVAGPDLATADACATAAFAMGERGPRWTARLRGYHAMTVLVGDRVLCTPGFVDLCAGATAGESADAPLESGRPTGPERPAGPSPGLRDPAGRCPAHR